MQVDLSEDEFRKIVTSRASALLDAANRGDFADMTQIIGEISALSTPVSDFSTAQLKAQGIVMTP